MINILLPILLTGSLLTNDPSAGAKTIQPQQIKEGNIYANLLNLGKQQTAKVEWPHVLKEEPTPKPQEAPQPAPAPQPIQTPKQAPEQPNMVTVKSTAYTASCEGCTGKTATGIDLNANPNIKLIAVDPSVIPLGKRVYVEGYGYAITGDTGGAIHGNRIDIYMASEKDALNWGVRTINVTVLD
jgi:3D (Asp-Asp-Asp) domain-containing protein